VVDYFDCPGRHMTYLPDFEFEGVKGVLLTGIWDEGFFYTTGGKKLGSAGFDFTDLSVSGTAYHDGKLYVASQTGKYMNEIYTFDMATRRQIGEPVQVVEDPAVYNLLSRDGEVSSMEGLAYAGGLSSCTLEDGTVALCATYQCGYITSRLMFLELETPGLGGYTLYRNGTVIAENLKTRHFTDELNQAGEYQYTVKVHADGKTSDFSPATTVKIDNQGDCLAVKDLAAHETNRWVSLDWAVASSDTTSGKIVGFTVFRNGTKIKTLWNEDVALFYNDLSDLKIGTPYTYRVETLYTSGCTASDSIEITLTDEGVAMAPFGLRINYKKSAAYTNDNKTYDVTANWETPMFEEPLAIGYGTGQLIAFAGFGEDDPLQYWAIVGWDARDLEVYEDLYLVGMEYMLGDNTRSFEAVVYINEKQVLRDPLKRTQAKAWQTVYFSQSFPMVQEKEVLLGYHITYHAGATPVAVDLSESKRFYSDII
ncbi:MAG: hypothetical protein K2L03_03615, partial [Bacteroidales bacterium]|nr:hypothetical protein [Bacteroidales bacterium]